MKFRLILLLLPLMVFASCSKDNDDADAKKLIVGKWVYRNPGIIESYDFYLFRVDGTGVGGTYNKSGNSIPNPMISPFRYAIHGGKIGRCSNENDLHPIKPGESCPSCGGIFNEFRVDKTSLCLYLDYLGNDLIFTRVEKWSDVGIPDNILPQ